MCGIFGILIKNDVLGRDDINKIITASRLLKHRGPDDEGVLMFNNRTTESESFAGCDSVNEIKGRYKLIENYKEKGYNSAFLHRRLSIIDLSANGHQPMNSNGGEISIVFNGEIYNYLEIKEELIRKGYSFRTKSDTEVILNAYNEWGTDCLNKFNGMWAFAIWDNRNKKLFLARDRFGIKPLHYLRTDKFFAFSSEIKPLKLFLKDILEEEEEIVKFLLYSTRPPTEKTYIKGIQQLPASHFAIYENDLEIHKYYDIPVRENNSNYLKEEFLYLLNDSLKLRHRSDVPIGTCLSGGFDSSSIVCAISKDLKIPVDTFSAVWTKYPQCDESKYIDTVNKFTNSNSHKVEPLEEEFEKVFSDISYYQEIPTAGPGLIPQWYVMQEAQGKVKVLLNGQGGDEVFGGYFNEIGYLRSLIVDKNYFKFISNIKLSKDFIKKNNIKTLMYYLFPRQYLKLVSQFGKPIDSIINPEMKSKLNNNINNLDLEIPKKFSTYLNNILYGLLYKETIPVLLHYEDRASMAHSIESRVPFLDYRLVEFGLNLRKEYLVKDKISRPFFRESMKEYLPSDVYERKDKLGYPTPFSEWIRAGLKGYVENTIFNTNMLSEKYFDVAKVRIMWEKHIENKLDYSWFIWRILSLEKWMRNNIN